MASFLRSHSPTIIAVGAGLAIGTVATYIVQAQSTKLSRQLTELTIKLDALRREVDELKRLIDLSGIRARPVNKNRVFETQSEQASSGDDDDEFQEAISGSEFEPLSNGSSDRFYSPVSSSTSLTSAESIESLKQLTSRVDLLLDGGDEDKRKALQLLQRAESQLGNEAEFLWRYAKSAYNVSQIEGALGNEETKKSLVYKSHELASKALSIDSINASAHKWYAITLGSLGDYEGMQVKIQNGFTFKDHIEKAIVLQPDDPSSHHLLGRWCYGVYMLSWVERQVAGTLFAAPPTSTVEEALTNFVNAEKLNPGKWKENQLFIAKCLIEKRDYYKAVEWLDKATSLPVVSQDDRTAQQEIDGLLYKYSGYRR